MRPPPHVRILGVPVTRSDPGEAVVAIEKLGEREEPSLVAYVNAHTLNLASSDREYHDILTGAGIVLNDGIGIQLAARMRRTPFPANLNGSDFNPRILELAAARGWKVFLLGAGAGVAEVAAERLTSRIPGLMIVGTHHGYQVDDHEVAALVRSSQTDVLMVAMGNPKQEKWLHRNLVATGARLGVGVGAFFDFTAGAQKRAPAWMNRAGLEWVYRLARDPARLWNRYVVGNPLFLWRAWRSRRADMSAPG